MRPTSAVERHTVIALLVLAPGVLLALWLGAGGAALAGGAVLLVVAALAGARYAAGSESVDGDHRGRVPLLSAREPTLRHLASAVEEAQRTEQGYEWRLRPLLERLYAARLAERHGVSLHTERQRAAALVGAEAWPWIDPRRPPGTDPAPPPPTARHAAYPRPVPQAVLTLLVERLERL